MIRKQMAEDYAKEETDIKKAKDALKEQEEKLQSLRDDAEIKGVEKVKIKSNKEDIQAYISALTAYIDEAM